MAVQEISSGGSSTPTNQGLTGGLTSADAETSDTSSFDLQQFLQDTAGLNVPTPSSPVQIDPWAYNLNTVGTGSGPGSNVFGSHTYNYTLDPYMFGGMQQEKNEYIANGGTNVWGEVVSPGYQAFGQSWLDLLNTIGTQDLQWGGINDFGQLKGQGSVTPWDTQNIVSPWNDGKQQDAYYNAVDFISKQTGLDPSTQEAQQLGGAYLQYTLQNNDLYKLNAGEHASRDDKGILGDVVTGLETVGEIAGALTGQPEIVAAIALAEAGQNFAEGNDIGGGLALLSAASAGAGSIADADTGIADALGITDTAGVISPSDAALLSDIGTAGQAAGLASGVGEVIQGGVTGNIPEAISGGISVAGTGAKLYDNNISSTGGAGTNASSSGGVTSSVANSLGVNPEDLQTALDVGQTGVGVAGTVVPLVQNALNAPNPSSLPGAVPPPVAAAPAPPPVGPPDQPGEPLGETLVSNPSQSSYKAPQAWEGNPATLGGGLSMESMLRSLGSPV